MKFESLLDTGFDIILDLFTRFIIGIVQLEVTKRRF